MRGSDAAPRTLVVSAAASVRREATRRRLLLAVPAALLVAALLPALSPAASVRGKLHLHKPALTGDARWACPEGACDSIIIYPGHPHDGSGPLGGYSPADLISAYRIPRALSTPQTVALVDAYGYPRAEQDLAEYRTRFDLPPCTTANGCFKKVNQEGEQANYPPEEPGWDTEAALDEDMVSAACPQCHIVMVEGNGEFPAELGEAENTAASLGATEISNSYGYPELYEEYCGTTDCAAYDSDYDHPGVDIFASAGDEGYADTYYYLGYLTPNFPATSQYLTAVGGTALVRSANKRGWSEEVWNEPEFRGTGVGTGSGCSYSEPKPSWQTDSGCSMRTDNDVSAVAAVETPVVIRIDREWLLVGGTSVSSPLVAGIMAHASTAERDLGAEAFYEDPDSLNDVTRGNNWDPRNEVSECAPVEYLCNAEVGYDGPTGLGTPNGVPGESVEGAPTVTGVRPDSGPSRGGTKVTVSGTGFVGVTSVKFGSNAAKAVKVTSSTSLTAVSPAGVGVVNVTVTANGGESETNAADTFDYVGGK
jgi:hypothetical protein